MKMSFKTISYSDLKTCRYLMKFSYIGTNYAGLQRQSSRDKESLILPENDHSVQYQIETSIQSQLRPIYGSRLAVSSRTDSGVHAVANAGHIDLTHPYINTRYKPSFITDSVNTYLAKKGQEIRILSTRLVGNGFNSRNDAKWRSYLYRLAIVDSDIEDTKRLIRCSDSLLPISELNRCHIIEGCLNIEEMERVVHLFRGEHDFASFTPKQQIRNNQPMKDTLKTILEFNLSQTNGLNSITETNHKICFLCFEIKSKSFLYNQIRRMVGSIIDVGLNRFPYKHIQYLLENPSHQSWNFQQTVAPAKGLWLTNVHYEESDLELVDDFGEAKNEFPNTYPNFNELSHFYQNLH